MRKSFNNIINLIKKKISHLFNSNKKDICNEEVMVQEKDELYQKEKVKGYVIIKAGENMSKEVYVPTVKHNDSKPSPKIDYSVYQRPTIMPMVEIDKDAYNDLVDSLFDYLCIVHNEKIYPFYLKIIMEKAKENAIKNNFDYVSYIDFINGINSLNIDNDELKKLLSIYQSKIINKTKIKK